MKDLRMDTMGGMRGLGLLVALTAAVAFAGCSQKTGGSAAGNGGSGATGIGGGGGTGGINTCDQDGDGYLNASCGGNDCNDKNPNVYPGAPEICGNHQDDNCDNNVDDGCKCTPGDRQRCYPSKDNAGNDVDPLTAGVGACAQGEQVCNPDGTSWGDCTGAVVPSPEGTNCDGIDQNCNNVVDDGLRNACGVCGPTPIEICGNGLDDDCNGLIDDPTVCTVSCSGIPVDAPPPGMECCFKSPDAPGLTDRPVPFSFTCVDDLNPLHGMQACMGDPATSRPCMNILGDGTSCVRSCVDDNHDGTKDRCLCGVLPTASATVPVQSASCGFPTACSHVTCDNRQNQPCYTGPPQTLGKGVCHGNSIMSDGCIGVKR